MRFLVFHNLNSISSSTLEHDILNSRHNCAGTPPCDEKKRQLSSQKLCPPKWPQWLDTRYNKRAAIRSVGSGHYHISRLPSPIPPSVGDSPLPAPIS